ncbi:MAG: hypothetical protein ACYDIA_02410 [Candidatus Humimicrobiaceae bacterium]
MNYLKPEILEVFIYLFYGKNKSIELRIYPAQKRLNIIGDAYIQVFGSLFYYMVTNTSNYNKAKIDENLQNLNTDLSYDDPETIEDYKKVVKMITEENGSAIFNTLKIGNISYLRNIIDFSMISEALELYYDESKSTMSNSFKKQLDRYTNDFENDKLIPEDNSNYYSFKNNLYNLCKIWQQLYIDSGESFNLCSLDREYEKKIRFYETILYLLNKGFIKINKCNFVFNKNQEEIVLEKTYFNLIVNLTFLKSPQEIYGINNFWTYSYGDVRVNESKCIAYYKSNKYLFKSGSGKAFKLLCFLLKNPGKELSIKEVADEIIPEYRNDNFKYKKDKIKDYVKEVKANLRINEDINPTVEIIIDGENIIMISNPPNPSI